MQTKTVVGIYFSENTVLYKYKIHLKFCIFHILLEWNKKV